MIDYEENPCVNNPQKLEDMELIDHIFDANGHANFLRRIRSRFDQAEVALPKIEVRYENISIEGDVHVGRRALPTLLNATTNFVEKILKEVHIAVPNNMKLTILNNVSGIIRPSRMTLLLGPPSSGKTTFLLALAGKLNHTNLQVTGNIRYCGQELKEFVPEKTCAYVSQNDLHNGEMTVRETLEFSRKCLGIGTNSFMLQEILMEREQQLGIQPDPQVDAFMKKTTIKNQETSLIIEYLLKILGLDTCADTIVGDEMRRGISGGEKKRLTIGEMLVGPAKVLLMDELSTGLDSLTAFQICKYISEITHIMDMTTVISILQPTPEIFELFDDIILLSDGHIVYNGPRDQVLDFFEYVGFECPERKGVADFLQEVTSKTNQQQYWSKDQPYKYVSTLDFVQIFQSFQVGKDLQSKLKVPYHKDKAHPLALEKERYGITNWELIKVCFSREWLLMKRNVLFHVFKCVQLIFVAMATMSIFFRTTMRHKTVEDGQKYIGALFFSLANFVLNGMAEVNLTCMRLPILYKQRDLLFYPPWAYVLPVWILSIPSSFIESGLWTILTYYTIGYAPAITRFFCQWLAFFCIHQMALSLFRCIGALARTIVASLMLGTILLLFSFVLSGLIIAKDDVSPVMIWGYYLSPMMYGQHALVINEFLDNRWNISYADTRIKEATIGKVILASRGLFQDQYWYWISIAALCTFSLFFNLIFILELTYLNPISDSKFVVQDDIEIRKKNMSKGDAINLAKVNNSKCNHSTMEEAKGMFLPFQPLSIAFNNINYYVDTPPEMKKLGYKEDRIQLLQDVSGAFRPGVLTALLGITGAGKTTLLDVLAGKKSSGYIEGSIYVSGHPKNQATFARVCGYCEQVDIHSPCVTVYESLVFSAWLRLSSNIDVKTRKMFVDEVMRLVELQPLRDAIVGLPNINGLSPEQRKRLTIAVELVANPSIIFMDEPTSGLDARAAAIVMHTMRNIVNTGRTAVCTIHQPSIDVFEAFDELLLMKRGGRIIYAGALGERSHELIRYFESIPGVPKIKDGDNPATWMLDVTSPSAEFHLNLNFAELYINSEVFRRNQDIIEALSNPSPDNGDLYFPTKYPQPFVIQYKACFWKQYKSYWQNPSYNAVRFFLATLTGILLGLIFWNKGRKLVAQQDLMNFFGIMFSAVIFLGPINALNIQIVVSNERLNFSREKAAMMYSVVSFALAQLTIEVIYLAVCYTVYSLLLYSMIGFDWTARKFFYFNYFMLMCLTYYTIFGMVLISLTPRHEISAILTSFFTILWNLIMGFFLPRAQIPRWWRWYYWLSPASWTMYGLLTSQVGDNNSLVEVPEVGNVPLNLIMRKILGYNYDFLPFVAIAHIVWVLLFSFVFVCGIKFLNFQRR